MGFRSDERVPLRRTHINRLPSRNQQNPDLTREGSDTSAFRAALHGLTPDPMWEEMEEEQTPISEEVEESEARVTQPLPGDDLPLPQPSRMVRRPLAMPRRRMALAAVTLLVLLGISVPVLGSHLELLAMMVGAQNTGAPTPPAAGGAQVGAAPLPNTPTPSPTVPLKPITEKPTPTPTPPPAPPAPPYTTNGPYGNNIPPPGYTSFAVTEPSPDPHASDFGECTWWAQYKRPDENFTNFGAAMDWVNDARARGMTVTDTPVANATVVFGPGVQGASGVGHVSHVEKVLTGGWVLVSEMNFYWNGGGFARVNYRYIHVGAGVWFIH
jgi:surface antigen